MRIGRILAATFFAVSLHQSASAATIDFNSAVEPGGNTFVEGSVSITRLGGQNIAFRDDGPSGTRALLGRDGLAASQWTATFATLQNSVSIDLGDLGTDEDTIYLTAFDASNNQIATVSQFLPSTFSSMFKLNLAVADIKSIAFGTSVGLGGIYADNLTFSGIAAPSPVPIPAMLPIFAAAVGFLGFIGWRRRRRALAAA